MVLESSVIQYVYIPELNTHAVHYRLSAGSLIQTVCVSGHVGEGVCEGVCV